MAEPTLALIELTSIARGVATVDAMLKRAAVRVVQAHPFSPGRYLILVAGEVAEVEEALAAGVEVAAEKRVDVLYLPQAHEMLLPAIQGRSESAQGEATAVVECFSVATTLRAADAAAKAADVRLLELRLGKGIGGKGVFTMAGEQHSVEAALEAARDAAAEAGMLADWVLIPAPHAEIPDRLLE